VTEIAYDPVEETCRAPFVSVRLSPDGTVQACCVNEAYPLGSIADASLSSIWWGERSDRLRQAMVDADFSLGCQGCGGPRTLGLRHRSLAANYDHFDVPPTLGWPKHIEFALSNTCNLQCVQCNGDLSSAIRAQREHRPPLRSAYGDDFFEEIQQFLPHLEAAVFIGGEPFLMREVRRVWDLLLELDDPPEVWVTTNGTIWDDRVEHYLHGLKMGVSLSIDGVEPATIEGIRVGAEARSLLENRDRLLAATRSYGSGFKLNYCVMPQNWREYLPFLLEADRLDVDVFPARVERPAEHSLFHLPAPDLRAILDAMSDQGDEAADDLGRNRHVWDGTMVELTSHLADLVTPEPGTVAVAAPRRRSPELEAELARWTGALTEAGGAPPVALELRSGRVVTAECPDWAAFLGVDDWVGMAGEEILPSLQQRFATDQVPVPVPDEEVVHGSTLVLAHEGRTTRIHAVAVVSEDVGKVHVLLGLVAP
jgi:MoaA/NifB/PqqE/SkfB family radical SAM enzyme